jgi:PAS domain S-box-containing protein
MRLLPETIRGEFALFAVSLALPLVALIGYGLYDRTRGDIAASEAIARRLAESNADRVSEYVAGLRATLEAVARRPLVHAMDAKRCDPRLADLVDLYPRSGSLIVVDREGVIRCSSRPLPRGRVVRIVDEELLSAMLADPRFRVSKPVMSRVSATARWIVSAVQPVFGEGGALVGTVAMATDLVQWRSISPPEGLPAGAVVTVVTSDGTIIARSADPEKWISRKLWDERLLKQVLKATEGVVRAKGVDGVDRIFGVSAVAGLPWFVLAGLPEEIVFAPARARLMQTGALLALIVGIVMALAWGFVTRLSKPIRAIAEAVGARAEGGVEANIPVAGPIEVAHVARELNRMIAIQRRQADEDRRMKAELETANRQLRESEERLNFALRKSHTGGWDLDLVDHTAHRTLEHDRIFGYGSLLPQWTYEMFLEHVLPEDRAEVDRRFREATAAQTEWSFECRIRRVDGEVRWILATGEHQRDEAGQTRRMAGIVQDVTERRRAEQEIRDLNASLERRVAERTQQLEASSKELESFSYSVSHDLRAPLRAIDGFSRMLTEDCSERLDTEGRRLLAVIRENSQRMAQLIDDLLDFARLGKKPLACSAIDMTALAGKVYRELRAADPQGEAEFELAPLPQGWGDSAMLRQVLVNLLSNALKYVSRERAPRIEARGWTEGDQNIYCVKDNGVGFDMKYYDKVFGVFQRLHSASEFPGTGVGLAIVQRVVQRHGGRVWAESKLDEGSSFYFSLPKTATGGFTIPAAPSAAGGDLK